MRAPTKSSFTGEMFVRPSSFVVLGLRDFACPPLEHCCHNCAGEVGQLRLFGVAVVPRQSMEFRVVVVATERINFLVS